MGDKKGVIRFNWTKASTNWAIFHSFFSVLLVGLVSSDKTNRLTVVLGRVYQERGVL